MANRNGMGPFNEGPLSGRGRGVCLPSSNTARKMGIGLGMGMGLAWGCRQGMRKKVYRGRGVINMGRRHKGGLQNNLDALDEYKNYLEEELEAVNKQFESKDRN